jgi:hypothetical protein
MSRLYLWFNPCASLAHFSHTGLRAQSAPGFPCASLFGGVNVSASPGQIRAAGMPAAVLRKLNLACRAVARRAKADRFLDVIASEAKQSIAPYAETWIAFAFALKRFGGLEPCGACAASEEGSSLSLLAMMVWRRRRPTSSVASPSRPKHPPHCRLPRASSKSPRRARDD